MILGLGVASADPERLARALARNPRLADRLFTAAEQQYAARRRKGWAETLAVRFAAKRAARAALGFAAPWREFEVARERGQPPTLRLAGRAALAAERLGVERIAVTLTHDAGLCLAQVIFEDGR